MKITCKFFVNIKYQLLMFEPVFIFSKPVYRPREAHKPACPEENSVGDAGGHIGEDQRLLPDPESGSSRGSTPSVLLCGDHHPRLVQTGLFWFY